MTPEPGSPVVDDGDDTRWVAFVRADDTTGTIAALAGVFAARGVSVGSLATGHEQGKAGLVVVTFRTGERRQRLLVRTVARLPMVRGLVVRRADDPAVRAAAVVHLAAGVDFRPPPHAAVRWSGRTSHGEPLLLEGALVDVEEVVAAARTAGATADALAIQPPA
ncbi:MAG TPA: ACT domain-containing protein [Cellulomonas sp.]